MLNYADISAYNAITQRAQAAAQAGYNQSMASNQSESNAIQRATLEWKKVMDTAAQTGKFGGQWSFPTSQWFTDQFGTWYGEGGSPGDQRSGGGATTLNQQNQQWGQMSDLAKMYGQYFAPGQLPDPGMATQASIQQASDIAARQAELTGWYNAPGVLSQGTGSAAATPLGTGYFVGGDHRIHQGTSFGWGQPGWDPNTPGGGSGLAADPSWAVGSQVSDPSLLLQPAAQVPGSQAANAAAASNVATGAGGAPGGVGQQPGAVQTLAGNEQAYTQNLRAMQEARAAQNQQQTQAGAYLTLLSNLRGPADWAKYQQVLGSTPGGMRDLVAAAAGQYVPGGGATTGVQPQAVSLQSMMGDVSGQPYYGQGGGQLNMPNVYGYSPQTYQPMYSQGGYGQQQAQPAGQTWGSGIGVGQQQPTPDQQYQGMGNGTNTGGYNMPAPNQISAQAWNNLQPSQKQMFLGMYENQGWDKGDVENLFNQSLPRYATNNATAGTWGMR